MKSNILRALAMVMLLIVVACGGDSISEASFDEVKTGMTLQEVKDILGEPSKTEGAVGVEVMGKKLSGGVYSWNDGAKVIKITFADDKVTLKSKNGF